MTVYKMIQVVGTSSTGFSDAVRGAVQRAQATIEDVRWFEVKEMRGRVDENGIAEYQVKIDIGFHLHASGKETGDAVGQERTAGTRAARSAKAQAAATKGRRRMGSG